MNQEKIKVLALCDYACSTGFGVVSQNIMRQLYKTGKYEVDIIAINYTGDPYDSEQYPGNVFPAMIANEASGMGDAYGRQRFLDKLGTGTYDVVFILQDTFVVGTFIKQILETREGLKKINKKQFSFVFYYPLDAAPKGEWIEQVAYLADYPVTYTNWAKRLSIEVEPKIEGKLGVIYHGTEFGDFFPVVKQDEIKNFRHNYFNGAADGRFLILNVNRNQPRKDVFRTFMVLNELRKRGRKEPILYMHMAHDDNGGNLLVMADHFGFKLNKDYILPHPKVFNVNTGIGVDMLNFVYNVSDCLITTTLGEGWGLSVTEAMATKLPVVAPNHSSLTEMLADNRGLLVPSGDNPSMFFALGSGDMERMRPLMNVEKAADAIERVMDGDGPDTEAAYDWVRQYNWTAVCEEWQKVFDRAALDARTATQYGAVYANREIKRKARKGK